MEVAVIGAGIAGIATSIRLAVAGFDVTVFEKNDYVGGKMHQFSIGGFRFDRGPSLFTMPHFVTELFDLSGEAPEKYFRYYPLEIACNYFDGDKRISANTSRSSLVSAVEKEDASLAISIDSYLEESADFYELSKDFFVEDQKSMFSYAGGKMAITALKNGLFGRLSSYNERIKDGTWQKVFNRFATYNGSNPYQCPAVLSCIASLEHTQGAFFPKGGMHAIISSLHGLAERNGVKFKLGRGVDGLKFVNGRWEVSSQSEKPVFDLVVNAGDVGHLDRLLDGYSAYKVSSKDLSTSALVFYWGINREFRELDVHNIFFANDYKAEFDALEKQEIAIEDLTIYVHVSSKVEKKDAPEGMENWFVMVNVPPQRINDEKRGRIKEAVLDKLSQVLSCSIKEHIEVEEFLDPGRIERFTSSVQGALYGLNSNSVQNILRRPGQKTKYKGLFNVGGSVFPGGGIPLCLKSAEIVTKTIRKEYA